MENDHPLFMAEKLEEVNLSQNFRKIERLHYLTECEKLIC